jgi:threonine dehydrogenase-like Zn-dependent dehydrogenase
MGMRVAALSSSPSKKELATQLGANYYFDSASVDQAQELQKLGGADLIVCTAPHSDILTKLIPALAPGGTVLILAGKSGHVFLLGSQVSYLTSSRRQYPTPGIPFGISQTVHQGLVCWFSTRQRGGRGILSTAGYSHYY